MSYTREPLSGSTHGRGIKVVATASAGTTIHTAQGSTTLTDVITLYATNTDTVVRTLTLEWGGTTAPDDVMKFDLPPGQTVPVVVDMILRNSLIVKAYVANAANLITIHGFSNTET